ncbi:hypothetical protein GCM10023084_04660 [Streptomyces lacrimifluminis]|uniref:Uncharacterized protein n=1 Tax=Streptomyces lacrimifluminis TaxID=1500077 RepID=A0A917NRR2_9ACTN|nr:hypothetical protein GCM10012282_18400 [Streptomyces lacrimifluminis]
MGEDADVPRPDTEAPESPPQPPTVHTSPATSTTDDSNRTEAMMIPLNSERVPTADYR